MQNIEEIQVIQRKINIYNRLIIQMQVSNLVKVISNKQQYHRSKVLKINKTLKNKIR